MTDSEIKAVLSEKGTVAVFQETPDYIVLLKGAGIPSAPLAGGMRSAFEVAADTYPEICSVKGKNASEGGLIHRIDNDTAGLLLIARTQRFYDMAQAAQKAGSFRKEYTAYCSRSAPAFTVADLPYTIESRFRPLGEKGAMVKPVFENGASRADLKKAGSTVYTTSVLTLANLKADTHLSASEAYEGGIIRARCSITAGFRHQVRAHLSSAGYPVIGDKLYGAFESGDEKDGKKAAQMLFFASALELKEAGLSVRLPEEVLDEVASEVVCL